MPDEPPQFTIVGAGLAGTLMACYLGKAGYRVDVYEKRPDPRIHEPPPGRSINLALSLRGIHALREVGLADAALAAAIPLRGRMIHDRDGRLAFQPYGKDDSESINSISRAGLNLLLVNAAASYPTVRLFFRRRCIGIDLETATIDLIDDQTMQTSRVPCTAVIGADGVYSAVRARMQLQERFNYQQEYLDYGYKELTIPPAPSPQPLSPEAGARGELLAPLAPEAGERGELLAPLASQGGRGVGGEGGGFRLEKHALHIWPRRSFMMIALPNRDGSFTCTLFWPYEGPNSFAALQNEAELRRFFQEQFPDALPLMPALAEEYRKNPVGPLLTVRCSPWHVRDRIVLIGDAAHAVVPFLGQGMNAAFEDCTILAECLARHGPDREAAFRDFEARRKIHTDALAELCLLNFIEMRDRVGSRLFLLRKRFENSLHKLFPRWYLPLYTMIQFTRIPYADAWRRARRQDRIVGAILSGLLALLVLGMLWLLFGEGAWR
ncbi:MAG TPA: NAD(P)/FAD-dependent oxidoreductase [Gemmataceae bacterium]|nr:NAD(P)/FAD-dependent oxidoreductase [Gemmataceae bacterium]